MESLISKTAQKRLATGWNTWNTRSIISHVLLPEGIAINLGFKHYRGGDYLKEALIGRQGEHDERVHPGPRSYDGRYTELRLEWKDMSWTIQSAADGDECMLLITPHGPPSRRAPLVVAEIGLLWNRPGSLYNEGDALVARTPGREIRVFGSHAAVDEPYITAQTPYLALENERVAGFSTGRQIPVAEIQAVMAHRRQECIAAGQSFGEDSEVRNAMQTCLAWDTIYDPLYHRVMSPVSRIWNCNWGGWVMFCWDTFFASAMASLEKKDLAYANFFTVLSTIQELGFVPNGFSPMGLWSRDRSQPPVGSISAELIFQRYQEVAFLEEAFEPLLKWNRWWPEKRCLDGLLAHGSNPFEPVVGSHYELESGGVNGLYGAAFESGLDNSPMYDDLPFDKERNVVLLQDVGLNSLYIRDCDALANIARILGRQTEARELYTRAEKFRSAMGQLWDEETGLFLNRRTDTGELTRRLTPTHFYPLLAKVPTPSQARRMIDEHFFNPNEFWGEWILPSCARNDPAFPDQEYWRGRIWPPMNFLVYLGLCNYDLPDARKALSEKSRALLLKEWRSHGHVHENYCPTTGEGCNHIRSDAFYHWGGLLGLITLMESGRFPGPALQPAKA